MKKDDDEQIFLELTDVISNVLQQYVHYFLQKDFEALYMPASFL